MNSSGDHAVYLDCAATTPLDPRVRDLFVRHLEQYGNAGSRTHAFGHRARTAVEQARQQVAETVAASRSEVIFTSGATESNNLAILGLEKHARDSGKGHIVTTSIEHSAVLGPVERLERAGFRVTRVPPQASGQVPAAAVEEALRPDTFLVSVMQVNNETGVRQPIEALAAALERHSCYFHVDGAQGFGKEIEALRHPRIDLISISGHKIHAPQGVGALIVRRRGRQRAPLAPLLHGGGQELGLRSGTLPVALAAALGHAAGLAMEEREQRAGACHAFRQSLLAGLRPLHPVLNGDPALTVPNIINLSIPGVDAEGVMEAWSEFAAVSDGAACTSQLYTCSHVLSAMRLSDERKAGAIRLSWCHMTPAPDYPRMVESVRALQASTVS